MSNTKNNIHEAVRGLVLAAKQSDMPALKLVMPKLDKLDEYLEDREYDEILSVVAKMASRGNLEAAALLLEHLCH